MVDQRAAGSHGSGHVSCRRCRTDLTGVVAIEPSGLLCPVCDHLAMLNLPSYGSVPLTELQRYSPSVAGLLRDQPDHEGACDNAPPQGICRRQSRSA